MSKKLKKVVRNAKEITKKKIEWKNSEDYKEYKEWRRERKKNSEVYKQYKRWKRERKKNSEVYKKYKELKRERRKENVESNN